MKVIKGYEFFSSSTITEFAQKVANGDDFAVYIGRPDCGDCVGFEPTFIDIIKENNLQNKMYYLNVKWYRAEDTEKWDAFCQLIFFLRIFLSNSA